MGFFEDLRELRDVTARQVEVAGGVYSDPYNEIANISSVSDPKNLGRVKVSYQDGTTSDWIYILNGSNSGRLSAQFIGSPCLIGKSNGNSEDAFVLGFFNKSPEAAYPGAPLQLAVVSEQLDPYRLSGSKQGDAGLQCNKGNVGKVYVYDNEEGQVLRICLRVSSRQEGGEEEYAPVNLTIENATEKGVDPGVPENEGTRDYSKVGIPECTRALQGQIRNFSEDRKFRNFQIKCDRDEDGSYVWTPVSSPPIFLRQQLPPCTAKTHGVEGIIDSGRDSELAICLRYQGEFKWVHHTTREPVQFFKEDPPISKDKFLKSGGPVPALQSATPSSQDFIGAAVGAVLGGLLGGGVSPLGGGSPLLGALAGAGQSLLGTFDPNQALSSAALTALASNSGIPIAQVTSQLSSALAAGGVIDPNLASIFSAAGGLGDAIANGVRNNTLDQALAFSGQNAIQQALMSLSQTNRGIYTGYMSGGMLGAIDTAAFLGASQLPPEIAQYVSPIVGAAASILGPQPTAINNVIGSSIGSSDQPLQEVIGGLVNIAGGSGSVPSVLSSGALGAMQGGALGPIAQSIGGFAGLPGVPSLGDIPGVPPMASTALELLGMGAQFAGLLGPGGIGLQAFSALTGLNPMASILGGIPGLGGLFGGGGSDCPCDPKCRKTSHGEDSDGNKLLEKCGNVVANSHSSYDPIGDPTNNNNNKVAQSIDKIATLVGEELCIQNPYDLTDMIQSVSRLGEMADRIESAKHADWPELWAELTYTFETIEKAFKKTDNNITGVESVERKLIDAQHRLIDKLMVGDGSFFSKTLISIVDTSKAIQDVYNFVLRLDATKKGGKVGVFSTDSLKIVFENITKIALLNSASKKEASFILSNVVNPADKEWRKLAPGLDLLNLSDIILGAVPIDIPLNFSKCITDRDKNKVLKDSLESKLNSLVPPDPGSITQAKLPSNITSPEQFPSLTDQTTTTGTPPSNLPSTSEVLDQTDQTTTTGTPSSNLPSTSEVLDQTDQTTTTGAPPSNLPSTSEVLDQTDQTTTTGTPSSNLPSISEVLDQTDQTTTTGTPSSNLPSISEVLDQIAYNQDRTNKGDAEC